MIMKWKLDFIAKNKNNDVFFMFNEIYSEKPKNIDYCVIIYKDFSRYYIDEMSNKDNVGVYTSGNSIYVGRVIELSEKEKLDARKKIAENLKNMPPQPLKPKLVGPMICPISKRVVQEPIAAADGYLYEKSQMKTKVDEIFQDIIVFNLQFTEIYDKVVGSNGKDGLIKSGEILPINNFKNKITKDNFKNLILYSENLNRYAL